MSCRTCKYSLGGKIPSNNTFGYTTTYICTKENNKGAIVNPYDICDEYQDKNMAGGVVMQVANKTNKKCSWLNKNGECCYDENCIVIKPDCDGCFHFEESNYDPVSKPDHYAAGRRYEPKDVIRDWDLNFNLGSAIKYISRAGRKDDIVQDLKKARQFLDFEIESLGEKEWAGGNFGQY